MLNKLKDTFKTNKVGESKEITKEDKEIMKQKELEAKKQRLENKVKELREFKNEVIVMLPFEKMNLLEAETDLLEVRGKIMLDKIVKTREEQGASPELDKVRSGILKAIEEKKEKHSKLWTKGRSLRLPGIGLTLERDPRVEARKELARQNKYKESIRLINEQINYLSNVIVNNKKIMQLSDDKLATGPKLPTVTNREIKELEKLKQDYDNKVKTDWQAKLESIEKKMEEVRADLIEKKELEEEYSDVM